MKKTTLKGTNDYLPQEVLVRDYLQNKIIEIYRNNGFERISTPIIEDIENLDKSEGGENLNLIFKILKRGDKLTSAIEKGNYNDLADMGLRYDLTLPLSRYIANNKEKLVFPMKCIQVGNVYRAERPQKGRLREFTQCDIDIIGSSSPNCEIELILTTAKALTAIGLKNFRIKINDRRILRELLKSMGFEEEQLDGVCIIFDKMDKIGTQGVISELKEKEYNEAVVEKFQEFLERKEFGIESIGEYLNDKEAVDNVKYIMDSVKEISDNSVEMVFDISLVRGQGYYTGTVFEVESVDFKGAVGGGGRYDNLIGKFTGEAVSAVGFSIGFERIFAILMEQGVNQLDNAKKVALLYEDNYINASKFADELRKDYQVSMFERPKKTGKFLNKLQEQGYYGYYIYGQSEAVNELNQNN